VTAAREPLVACINHPADFDVAALRERVAGLARPVELLVAPYKENLKLRLAKRAPPVPEALLSQQPEPDAALRDAWARCEVLMGLDLPSHLRKSAPLLRWIQAFSAGIEHLGARELLEHKIRLTTAAGAGAGPIAEFVIARLLEVWKATRHVEAMQRARRFTRPQSRLLEGSTLGIVGLGAIGSAVAQRAAALGMRVLATRRHFTPGQTAPNVQTLYGPDGLDVLLARCDALVLAAPDTPETRDLIDARALAAIKPGAVLVNVARGALIDEAALIEALPDGRLGAAILDVTRQEPLPDGDPLWDAPNLYLSPHCAVSPDVYVERALDLFVDNLTRYAAGEPLRNEVTQEQVE
jgi:phosphoglycerate dehydrogenase-like enzyme